jgi:hypothetical protein
MTNSIKYVPIIKTGDAEIRGLENLTDRVKTSITPLVELTRSRSTKTLPRGDVLRRIDRFTEAYGNRPFILDLTAIPELKNEQIDHLLTSRHGYENWTNFADHLSASLPSLIPTVQVVEDIDDADEIERRLRIQVDALARHFPLIAYRFSPLDLSYADDLRAMAEGTEGLMGRLICIVDCDFIGRQKAVAYAQSALAVVHHLATLGIREIVVAGTSFPQNPTDYGDDDNRGGHTLEEVCTFEQLRTQVSDRVAKRVHLIYGDYASINPHRNDQRGGSPWVPRIDIPTETELFYRRSRRNSDVEESYRATYTRVARSIVRVRDYHRLRNVLGPCWGLDQVDLAASGSPQGLHPSFWISVRMNIHITIRCMCLSRA